MKTPPFFRSTGAAAALLVSALTASSNVAASGVLPSDPVGTLTGAFEVGADGSATYSLPLWVPDGRAGMQPSLTLTHQNGGNGLLGVGWSVAGASSAITRCGRSLGRDNVVRGVELTTADYLCLDGVRLKLVSGASYYGSGVELRTEPDTFAKVVSGSADSYGPLSFTVWTKDGRILTYGGSSLSRLEATKSTVLVLPARYGWLLTKAEDRFGNTMTYSYGRPSSYGVGSNDLEYWPSQITYTGSSVATGNRTVTFEYAASRPDPIAGYLRGIQLRTTRLMTGIAMAGPATPAGSPVPLRRYNLAYSASPASGRSLLTSVQACDGAGACMPKTTLSYSGAAPTFTETTTPGTLMTSLLVTDVNGDARDDLVYLTDEGHWSSRRRLDVGFAPAADTTIPDGARAQTYDIDADGKVDLFVENETQGAGNTTSFWSEFHTSDGMTLDPSPDWIANIQQQDPHGRIVDVDGDLLADYVFTQDSGHLAVVRQTQALAWAAAEDLNPLVLGLGHAFVNTKGIKLVDIDGDGVTDVLLPFLDSGSTTWTYHALQLRPGNLTSTLTNLTQSACNFFVDVNGDGLADVVNLQSGISLRINRGNGQFTAAQDATVPGQPFAGLQSYCSLDNDNDGESDADTGVRVVDFNQDGKQDLLLVAGVGPSALVLQSNGTTLAQVGSGIPLVAPLGANSGFVQTMDANGDGLFDLLQVTTSSEFKLRIQQGTPADLLVGATDGLGGQRLLTITPFSQTNPDSDIPSAPCPHPQRCYMGAVPVVTEEWVDTGTGLIKAADHEYGDPRVDTKGGGWLGFGVHRVFDPRTATTTETRSSQELVNASGPCRYPTRGLPTDVERTTIGGPSGPWITTRTHTDYTTTAACFTYPSLVRTYENQVTLNDPTCTTFDGTFPCPFRVTTTTSSNVDAYGNIGTVETTVGPTSTFNPATSARTTTTRTFSNTPSTWLLGLPLTEVTTHATPQGSQTRTVASTYASGLLKTQTREPADTGARYLKTTLTRSAAGLLTAESTCPFSGSCRNGSVQYDADGVRVLSTTNALGHVTSQTWHAGLGVALTSTDENGVTTSLDWDGFGRPRASYRADGSWIVTQYLSASPYPFIAYQIDSSGRESAVFLDRVGRKTLTYESVLGGDLAYVSTAYDSAGRVASVTRPFFSDDANPPKTVFQYDGLGRTVQSCRDSLAGACTHTSYEKLTIDAHDESGIRSTKTIDASGTTVMTAIYPAGAQGAAAWTTLRYGPFGVMTSETDAQGNQVTLQYDGLGRRTSLVDADIGSVVTTYNAFGEVITQKDAKNQTTTMTYDNLGRMTVRSAPDGTDTWVYDTVLSGKGRLASRSRGSTTTAFARDALGRTTQEAWTIDGETFAYDYTYDAVGRLSSTAYPAVPGQDRFETGLVYDGHGNVQKVVDLTSGTPVPLWIAEEADAEGHITLESTANNLTTSRSYDGSTGRLTHTDTHAVADETWRVHDVDYLYEPNGNLEERIDHRNSDVAAPALRSETFTYDGANRLASATVHASTPQTVTYAYDAIGNLTAATDTPQCQNLVYGGASGPHRLKQATCFGTVYAHTYDANGNETLTVNPDFRESVWTSFNQPSEVHSRWGRMAYTYDADHVRVKKQKIPGALSWANTPPSGAPWNDGLSGVWSTTVFAGGRFERRSSTASPTVDYVYYVKVGGRTVAQRMWRQPVGTNTGDEEWRYFHADFQGTVERTTDESGYLVEASSYDAWGQRRHPDWSYYGGVSTPPETRMGYTGHMEDDEWQLSYVDMGSRLYDPFFKRFTSADTVVPDVEHGPSWNRYSYVLGNPLRYVDPTGHEASGFFSPFIAAANAVAQLADGVATGFGIAVVTLTRDGLIQLVGSWSVIDIHESSPGADRVKAERDLEDARLRVDGQFRSALQDAFRRDAAARHDAYLRTVQGAGTVVNIAAAVAMGFAVVEGAAASVLASSTPSMYLAAIRGGQIATPVLGAALCAAGSCAGAPTAVVSAAQSVEAGIVRADGKLAPVLRAIESEFLRTNPGNMDSALSVVAKAVSSLGLKPGFGQPGPGGSYLLQNAGNILTTIEANGSVLVQSGSQLVLHLVPGSR